MNFSHKKPGLTFWTTVVIVVVLAGYPVSFAVLAALDHFALLPDFTYPLLRFVYAPILRLLNWWAGIRLPFAWHD
jgi:hypothetical protein